MREIVGSLTPEIENFIGEQPIGLSDAYPVSTYKELIENIAKLAYLNKDHLLFFRGQDRDYRSKGGSSTIYPSIYRSEYLPQREINFRFDILNEACSQLIDLFNNANIEGSKELKRKRYIQWSILQHYGVCSTPLLDISHSIRVACSFAQLFSRDLKAYVFVFGFPYITNRISVNSEHDLVLVRLLSICPPDALRPYFQEGYLSGTADITNDYDIKTELDFKNRLIAKFKIPNSKDFWGPGVTAIPKYNLYPKEDLVEDLCKSIEIKITEEILPGQMGQFLKLWNDSESKLISTAKRLNPDIHTLRGSINRLEASGIFDTKTILEFQDLRRFRNIVVHEPKKVDPDELSFYLSRIESFQEKIYSLSDK